MTYDQLMMVRDRRESVETVRAKKTPISLPVTKKTFLNAAQISKIIGVSSSTVYNWASKMAFPSGEKRPNRAVVWKTSDVREWIKRHNKRMANG